MKNRNLVHKDDWATPKPLYDELNAEFNFEFDPCPYQHNMDWNGLEIAWKNSNYINPPYTRELKENIFCKIIWRIKIKK